MKNNLNIQIILGAVFGVFAGLLMNSAGVGHPFFPPLLYIFDLLGSVFVSLLKMILIPLVFASITVGIANLRAHAQMGKVWKVTLGYYILTTGLAVLLGLIVVNVFKPGIGLNLELFKDSMATFSTAKMTLPEFFRNFIMNLFDNPFSALSKGNVISVVIFSLLLGIGIIATGEKSKGILKLLNEFFEIIMLLVDWIMRFAPLGIFGLLAKLIATQNISILSTMGRFMVIVTGATLFHGIVVLPTIYFLVTQKSPIHLFASIREALITAFSTSSSSATLPVTIRCVEQNLKVDKDIAGFVLPLGATINMDGTALYEAFAAIFIANLAGVELNLIQQMVVFFMAILASIGAPGIPSAGMVTMAMVLQSVGLPIEGIAILLPIDRPLDAVRTTINVTGDCVGSAVVQKLTASR